MPRQAGIMKIYKEWLKPSDCTSFYTWLFHKWKFVNVEETHEWGVRILGLSISNFKLRTWWEILPCGTVSWVMKKKTFTRRCTICGRTPVCTSCNKCFNSWCNSGCRVCNDIRK